MVLDGKYVVFEPPQPAASSSVVTLRLNRNSPNGFPRFGEEGSTRRFPAAAPMSPVGHERKSVMATRMSGVGCRADLNFGGPDFRS